MTCTKIHRIFVVFILLLISGSCNPAAGGEDANNYELSLTFDLDAGQLVATARIEVAAGQRLTLRFPDLQVTGSLLRDSSGREQEIYSPADSLVLPATTDARTLFLSYILDSRLSPENLIDTSGISLVENWYPLPEHPVRFSLSASLPKGFQAITEADHFPLASDAGVVRAEFSQPTTAIHFIAGPYLIREKTIHDELKIFTLFFPEDEDLADEYLQAAADHVHYFESLLGNFPYNHYVIVANRLPTGYGMETFTLLGQQVVRLPFIKNTSLAHEIAHSWFGNKVSVTPHTGNWAEGLTTYLADHGLRDRAGEGVAARKEAIVKYLSYARGDAAIPLASFRSASHDQPLAEAVRAVGYNRGALFFHELETWIGRPILLAGLKDFYQNHKGGSASWSELEKSISRVSGLDLATFFVERLHRTEIPTLSVDDIHLDYADSQPRLNFTLHQDTDIPFSLRVPVVITTMTGTVATQISSTQKATKIVIPLKERPLDFTIDPRHTVLRQLYPEETPPVWSQFLGAPHKMIILASQAAEARYQPLVDLFAGENVHLKLGNQVTNSELRDHDLLFLGTESAASRSLFARPGFGADGLTLDVRPNPLDRAHVAVLVESNGLAESQAAARRLMHYGKYSTLQFTGGRNQQKTTVATVNGIRHIIERLPSGVATTSLDPFRTIMGQLTAYRVIYLGEHHTSLPDHLLQLRIIEALHRADPRLGIAMEMFPASSQPALDAYIAAGSSMDEQTFLKESKYYDVWRYDFRYFRDIFNFARQHTIPVVAINLDRDIVSKVYRSGTTDELDPDEMEQIPDARDLSLAGYNDRLQTIHRLHVQGGHGEGQLSGFVQAQAIWDETMADHIARWLTAHPDHRLVVLAGREHARKDSGIPPRVTRRIPDVQQATVFTLKEENRPEDLSQLTDYYFITEPSELPEIPKMGIVLTSHQDDQGTYLEISQLSPHGKAVDAGLREGDRLLSIDGKAVKTMADLRIAMLDTRIGATVEVSVVRGKDGEQQHHSFPVELSLPPPSVAHP